MINMGLKMLFSISFFQWVLLVQSVEPFVYDVNFAGAVGDGESDDTEAFKNAWNVICCSHIPLGIFRVPYGQKFLVQPLTFNGECRPKNITIQIDGILIAPSDPSSWKCNDANCNNWITFQHFDGLVIQGSGSLHGQGQKWWQMGCMQNKVLCSSQKAAGFAILDSKNVHISGLTSVDSRKWHISIERSSSVHASNLNIKAPEDSPNTDGIRIQHSTNVTISSSTIKTGDDCIGIGDGSKYININRILCGPGHGISIGSLGENGRSETVEYVNVRRASFYTTENGVRIKTWQGGHGYARHIRFEHISFSRVIRPIIIDQYSCPPYQHCKNYSTAVEVSNILYNDLKGTTSGEIAVELLCSESVPCKNIRMKDIQLDYGINGKIYDGHPKSHCLSVVQSWDEGNVYPNVACLTKKLSY
ncbi:polygalacturonase [Gossypium hirsutum]|uniref:Polygalacturonase n=1 Tax=Gossypium hirsutum TaxID=3635 RepID=A0ABM3ABB8_GOSHI|nr:polygalacturonase-like [Gossypium hirsutum]